MKILKIFCLSVVLIYLHSCSPDSECSRVLDDLKTCVNECPDSALVALKALDTTVLRTNRHKAEYALLYSIALDKNYIDLKTDSIIAPAVAYYQRHGDIESRFKCKYYQARIFENAGDVDNALLSIAKAEALDTSKVSDDMLSLLYAMKASIYYNAWREKDAIDAGLTAAKYALKAEKYRHYAYYKLMLSAIYRNIGDWQSVSHCISDIEQYKEYFTVSEVHLYENMQILQDLHNGRDPYEIICYAENYISKYPHNNLINWKTIARTYQNVGNFDKALLMLDRHKTYRNINNDPGYYAVLAEVLESKGELIKSLEASKKYAELIGNDDLTLFRSDLVLVEERYQNALYELRHTHTMIYIIIMLTIVLLLIMYIMYRWIRVKREFSALSNDYKQLMKLNSTLSELNDDINYENVRLRNEYQIFVKETGIDHCSYDEMRKVLNMRLSAMAKFLDEPVSPLLYKANKRISELRQNRDAIVESIVLLYTAKYPGFVAELSSYGLSLLEIGILCLYLLGLNIPEAGDVIGRRSSIYNLNSAIREKLRELNIDTKLDKWVTNYFARKYESEAE